MDEQELKQELKRMSLKDLIAFIDEQKKLGTEGLTRAKIAEMLEINRTTLNSRIKKFKENGANMDEQESTKKDSKDIKVHLSTQKKSNVNTGETKNANFNEEEIKVLKEVIKERKSDLKLFHEFRIYKELSKVPTNEEVIRSAFNMSKTTTERLKKYASERRLPLQDIVELAVINLLDQYDKKN